MEKVKFHITALFNGQASFHECILSCMGGLHELGYEVTYADNQLYPDSINIVFGSHTNLSENSKWRVMSAAAKDIIIYNWEQVGDDVPWMTPRYFRQMVNAHVWEYNANNMRALQAAGVADIQLVPMGYTKEMSTVPAHVEQDIDVLFYGVFNERRKKAIDAIRAKGLKVVATDTHPWMMGQERENYIARAKVVLNMHRFDATKIFEIARVSYLLANRKAVVSEIAQGTDIDKDIQEAIAHCSIDELPQLCYELVNDDERRHALAQKGFDIFTKRSSAEFLRPAIERYLAQRATGQIGRAVQTSSLLPNVLHIGAGEKWLYSRCNIDARADFTPDLTVDIGYPIEFDVPMTSWRFGQVTLTRQYFTKIIAPYVFQRVQCLQTALTNCLELLQDGGTMELSVPLDFSYDAWMDVEDKRAFNDKSWERIISNWWQYGWSDYRFEIISTGFGLHNEYGMQWLAEHNNDWGAALRAPRAIDVMHVTLRKRAITTDERKQLPQVRFLQ